MNTTAYHNILTELKPYHAQLVAVSKTKPVSDIQEMYRAGQRIFGENKVQEMVEKYEALPKDIEWHLIGHLQTNKVKYIAPFVSLIHSVDSLKLLQEIDKQAAKNNRVKDCLLQIYIANEETKFGLDKTEAKELVSSEEYKALNHIRICGVMGMATNTDDETQIETEFEGLKDFFEELKNNHFSNSSYFKEISMGMSGDYKLALKHGATLIRVGSLLFGSR